MRVRILPRSPNKRAVDYSLSALFLISDVMCPILKTQGELKYTDDYSQETKDIIISTAKELMDKYGIEDKSSTTSSYKFTVTDKNEKP